MWVASEKVTDSCKIWYLRAEGAMKSIVSIEYISIIEMDLVRMVINTLLCVCVCVCVCGGGGGGGGGDLLYFGMLLFCQYCKNFHSEFGLKWSFERHLLLVCMF